VNGTSRLNGVTDLSHRLLGVAGQMICLSAGDLIQLFLIMSVCITFPAKHGILSRGKLKVLPDLM